MNRSRRTGLLISLAGLVVGPLLLARPCEAQAPATQEYVEYRDNLPTAGQVKIWLSEFYNRPLREGEFPSPEHQEKFEKILLYKVAELTWLENLPDLPNKRMKIKKQDLATSGRQAPVPLVHDRMNTLLLNGLSMFALDAKYHPAARTNCMILLGQLDQSEPDGTGANAVPLPAGLDKILTIATDPKANDFIRIAALVGIRRHALVNMAPNGRTAAVKALTNPWVGEQPTAVLWMRRTAIEILGIMAAKHWPEANKPEVARAAMALLSDSNASLLSRCEAARTLGSLDKGALAATPAQQAVAATGALAVAICKSCGDTDANGLPLHKWVAAADSPSQKPQEILTSQFYCLHLGLKGAEAANYGVISVANKDQQALVNELDTKITQMVEIASTNKTQIDAKLEDLQKKGDDLDQWLKSKVGAAGDKVAGGN